MLKRFLGTVVLMLLVLAAGTAVYLFAVLPAQRPAPDVQVALTPETIERGRYLAENVILCNDCHSERDWTYYGGPVKPPVGAGRECMTRDKAVASVKLVKGNFPGIMCMRNITPDPDTGIGEWTDGELVRSIREGVNRDGEGLFPIMPYFIFRTLSDRDTEALVAYMRTLTPVREPRTGREIDFPMNLLVRVLPEPLEGPVVHPDESDTIAYGEYLATVGRCEFCHTPRKGRGSEGLPGKRYAGGVPFSGGDDTVYSSNLTPHDSGLGGWSKGDFVGRFKAYVTPQLAAPGHNTLMDWSAYAGMTEADLGAIYDFLQTLQPVAFEPMVVPE